MTEYEVIIRAKLAHDPDFLRLCIERLYAHQESDEQEDQDTHHENGVGFNKSDSGTLSEYAELIHTGITLTSQQQEDAARRMIKYTKQLLHYLSADEIE